VWPSCVDEAFAQLASVSGLSQFNLQDPKVELTISLTMTHLPPSFAMRSSFTMPVVTPRSPPRAFSAHDAFGILTRSGVRRPRTEIAEDGEASSDSENEASVQFLRTRRKRLYEPDAPYTANRQFNGHIYRDYMCVHDYRASPWGTMLRKGDYKVEGSRAARNFRNRFRVPATIFEKLVEQADEFNLFDCAARDATSRIGVPIEIKLFATLRILGRGAYFDDIPELSGMSTSTAHRSFRAYIRNFSAKFYNKYVFTPEGQDLQKTMDHYSRMGLDGAIGSCDNVHVPLQMCPADYYWRCVGKEGKPTLSYSVSVDHTRRIQHSSRSFFGARNDKTTSLFDPWLTGVHSGILPKSSVFYELMNADGTFSSETVAWLICDGGYHKWATMICPYGATSVRAERLWSEMLESVHKDVECVFGIMKSRFRILRHGMRIHYFHEIDAVWFTCCIMHNMMLEHDGYTDALNTEEAWESLDPEIAGGRAQLMLTRIDAAAPPQHVTVLSQMPAATSGTVWLGPTAIFPALEMYNSMLLRQSASGQPGTPQVSVHPARKRMVVWYCRGQPRMGHRRVDSFYLFSSCRPRASSPSSQRLRGVRP
jgi:hypothetical protein